MKRVSLAALLFSAACFVDVLPYAGRDCDTTHPCLDGRSCLCGKCLDAGLVWDQSACGFAFHSAGTGCSVTVDAAHGNAVSGTVAGSVAGANTAYAAVNDPALLASSLQGSAWGVLHLTSSADIEGSSPFFVARASNGLAVVELQLEPSGIVQAYSRPNMLAAEAFTDAIALDGGYQPGDYRVGVAWKSGVYRTFWVNDQRQTRPLSSLPDSGGVFADIDLGIWYLQTSDGGVASGWSDRVDGWELSTNPTAGP